MKNKTIKQYFSFGFAHKHILEGEMFEHGVDMVLDKDILIEIEAPSMSEARNVMFYLFGPRWSFQYDEPHMEFFPRGIYVLNFREE